MFVKPKQSITPIIAISEHADNRLALNHSIYRYIELSISNVNAISDDEVTNCPYCHELSAIVPSGHHLLGAMRPLPWLQPTVEEQISDVEHEIAALRNAVSRVQSEEAELRRLLAAPRPSCDTGTLCVSPGLDDDHVKKEIERLEIMEKEAVLQAEIQELKIEYSQISAAALTAPEYENGEGSCVGDR